MASLKQRPEASGEINQHVIFVHGLDGNQLETWQSLSSLPEFWPKWLMDDIEGVAIWTVNYKAKKTRWFSGSGMHVIDRGANIFEIIASEPGLQTGEIIFVGHSLGGLVIKQVLRVAESQSLHRNEAERFLRRVRRVAFLATPHFGSSLSSWSIFLRVITRPTLASYSLALRDPNLRGLNNWYKSWSEAHKVEHLILMESELSKLLGPLKSMVVEPESADPGLSTEAIMVDADHYNICKPHSRNSEIYIYIRNLISKKVNTSHRNNLIEQKIDQGTKKLEILQKTTKEELSGLKKALDSQPEKTAKLVSEGIREEIVKHDSEHAFSYQLFDAEIEKSLSAIRKSRFFGGFPTLDKVNRLSENIIDGGLRGGSPHVKSLALAWCARLQSLSDTEKANKSLENSRKLGDSEEVNIAEAFLLAQSNELPTAIEKLMSSPSELKYSAAFFIIKLNQGAESALQWMNKSNVTLSDFDVEGKISFINTLFSAKQWGLALTNSQEIEEAELKDSPALLMQVAMANLVMVIPKELRTTVLTQIPFSSKEYPLYPDETSFKLRNKAIKLFSECSVLARKIGCNDAADFVDDYILWLELRDPEKYQAGMSKLKKSMNSDAESALRRFPMALEFDVDMDIDAVEKEVDTQTARTSGRSVPAGLARFALALTKKTPKDIVEYINEHRQQLISFISKESFCLLEIEALARAGLVNEAESRLSELGADEISTSVRDSLNDIIAISKGADPIALCIAKYEKTSDISDLALLVNQLEKSKYFKQLHEFAVELFKRTKSIVDAERLVNAKVNLKCFKDVNVFLNEHLDLIKQSEVLSLHWAWSLFREGRLTESKAQLKNVSKNTNQSNIRALEVNIAITSGDWETLLPYIENEWQHRDQRTAEELLQASQLAKALQPKRAKDLILSATQKESDNPAILASAFFAASSMGWEDESIASDWLHDATKLSGEDGPFQSISLKDFYESMPERHARNSKILQALNDGTSPVFIAAKLLNKTLTDFYLLLALSNIKEPDLRWRTLVPAFSNVRLPYPIDSNILSIDTTALLTLGFLSILELVIDSFELIIIPHSTLGWLFGEKQKVVFHQPSKIQEAKQIRQMLADKNIGVLEDKQISNTELALDVGDELALLLQEAKISNNNNSRQRLVVRPYPVHKIGSFMNVEVDLSAYSANLCSCSSVVKKLRESGVLTSEESQIALDYLGTHEKEWPHVLEISDNAVIYLDGLSVTYLHFTGVLEKIASSELEVFVNKEEEKKLVAMCNYEAITLNADKTLDDIRKNLFGGIETGAIQISPASDQSEDDNDLIHPTMEIFAASEKSEASIIDDRFLNQHKNIAFKSGESPVHTTLDLLDNLYSKSVITQDKKMSYITKLRKAGYVFIPLLPEELDYQLDKASIVNGKLQETAELRIIREYILQLKMSHLVKLPRDAAWISQNLIHLSHCLKNQWLKDHEESICIARSDWLLQLIDYREWSHCFDGVAGHEIAQHGAGIHINTLIMAPEGMNTESKERYWQWLDERVIEPLKLKDPSTFRWLVESAKAQISNVSERDLREKVIQYEQ